MRHALRVHNAGKILSVLALSLIATSFVACQERIPEDWSTYSSEEYGFTLRYPHEWSLEDVSSRALGTQLTISSRKSFDSGPPVDGDILIMIKLRPDRYDEDLATWFRLKAEMTERRKREYVSAVSGLDRKETSELRASEIAATHTRTRISGHAAIVQRVRYRADIEGLPALLAFDKNEYYIQRGGDFFSIVGMTPPGARSDAVLAVFDRVVSTLELADADPHEVERLRQPIDLRNYLTADGTQILARGKRVTDDDLAQLHDRTFNRVELLGLAGTPVTDAGLIHLRGLPLKRLVLSSTQVTDAGLVHLKEMPLEFLGLVETRISDAGLVHLKDLPLFLDIRDTMVSDEGLIHLKDTRLKGLFVDGTQVTDAGIEDLKVALPDLEILRLGDQNEAPSERR